MMTKESVQGLNGLYHLIRQNGNAVATLSAQANGYLIHDLQTGRGQTVPTYYEAVATCMVLWGGRK